jgi:hypothetical protein
MAHLKTYQYLDSDVVRSYDRPRFDPDRDDRGSSNPSGFDRLEKSIPFELADAWESLKGAQRRGSPIWATKLVRARDVQYFLENHFDAATPRSIAERDGLTVRAVQLAIRRGKQILADAIRQNPQFLALLSS